MHKGIENLRPFHQLPEEEQKAISSKGGRASGESRRKKRTMREQMEILLSLPVKNREMLENIVMVGAEEEEADNLLALSCVLYKKALEGNLTAIDTIRELIGEGPKASPININNEQWGFAPLPGGVKKDDIMG